MMTSTGPRDVGSILPEAIRDLIDRATRAGCPPPPDFLVQVEALNLLGGASIDHAQHLVRQGAVPVQLTFPDGTSFVAYQDPPEVRTCDDCGRQTGAGEHPDWPSGRCEDCDLHDEWTTCVTCGDNVIPRDSDGALVDVNGLTSCAPHAPAHRAAWSPVVAPPEEGHR